MTLISNSPFDNVNFAKCVNVSYLMTSFLTTKLCLDELLSKDAANTPPKNQAEWKYSTFVQHSLHMYS